MSLFQQAIGNPPSVLPLAFDCLLQLLFTYLSNCFLHYKDPRKLGSNCQPFDIHMMDQRHRFLPVGLTFEFVGDTHKDDRLVQR